MAILNRQMAGRLASASPRDDDKSAVLAAFTAAWERGHSPAAEDYLDRLDPADSQAAVEMVYREYCLAEARGWAPELADFVSRFPSTRRRSSA